MDFLPWNCRSFGLVIMWLDEQLLHSEPAEETEMFPSHLTFLQQASRELTRSGVYTTVLCVPQKLLKHNVKYHKKGTKERKSYLSTAKDR